MNYKIVSPDNINYPDVLLYRDRDEDGNEIVVIQAVGTIDEIEDMFASEEVQFESAEIAKDFIEEYTDSMAFKFCVRNEITN